ncbi:MAG TPA: flagellar biosynthetic protein FliO [Burkholderiaceae bacterium]|nr:flagellar biosynthetic protein FliO [Burkholderiaceae bacterium]
MTPTASIGPALLVFVAIIALIPAALWLLKRIQLGAMPNNRLLTMVGGLAVGPRERIAIVEAQGRWLMIGITAQSISLLATLDRPPQDDAAAAATPPAGAGAAFAQLLSQWKRNA